jgi:hypothetical protein
MDDVADIAVHHSQDCNAGFCLAVPLSVFTTELTATLMAMNQIVMTDSMASIRRRSQ